MIGLDGDFKGMEAKVEPRYDKIDEGIYFITWDIAMVNGYASLILNLNDNTVFGNYRANSKSVAIDGEVYYNEYNNTGTRLDVEKILEK